MRSFERDPYPQSPKILFIGIANSSHTHAWIDLLENAAFNVRFWGVPLSVFLNLPPESWQVRSYITLRSTVKHNPKIRHSPGKIGWIYWGMRHRFFPQFSDYPEASLKRVIRRWKPDIIHTLGLEPASYFYLDIRRKFQLAHIGKWVVQARGGPDIALHQFLEKYRPKIETVLRECNYFIADNEANYNYAQTLGLDTKKVASVGVVPGTGGVDVDELRAQWDKLPSRRERYLLIPKAYETPQNKALPVLEALQLAWDKIQPCQVYLLSTVPEVEMWAQKLPKSILDSCHLYERISRQEVLQMMLKARVVLAPSLSDGIPNVLYEAMACGAFPIVSALETITPIVQDKQNVLFAPNLYPEKIAEALTQAMNDDNLVDHAAKINVELVKHIANRNDIRQRVIHFYDEITSKN